MTDRNADISEAIVVFLKRYPGKNDEEFDASFDSDAREGVRTILNETSSIRIDWAGKSLIEIGREVHEVMHERHPELTDAALEKLTNYFTYLVK